MRKNGAVTGSTGSARTASEEVEQPRRVARSGTASDATVRLRWLLGLGLSIFPRLTNIKLPSLGQGQPTIHYYYSTWVHLKYLSNHVPRSCSILILRLPILINALTLGYD